MSGIEQEVAPVSNESKKPAWFHQVIRPFKEQLDRLCAPPPVSEPKVLSEQEMSWRCRSSESWNWIGSKLFPVVATVGGTTAYVTCEEYAYQTFTHLSPYGKGAILPSLAVAAGGIVGLLFGDALANGPRVNEETNIRRVIEAAEAAKAAEAEEAARKSGQ